ncbi:MAG: phosphopentomutase [Candidatus Edwardsbacteria bacterium GWF2_54_11]|uniref:Phosphopentomutase n=1 Tax=Candidatus Edwardsbacteria bacterium GWF2_54_11 TaxID=1817851 RepID=A0A1F5RIU4_9BACT|nr:MAG: phosphopentomutase [Candidatus Edwardsbacteria bacterium GWF2_54_11]
MRKAILIVLDGCGVGELPDAAKYGDSGSNTLGNLSLKIPGGFNLPNLQKLGLGNIIPLAGMEPSDKPSGNFGKMAERSPGKDSTDGHWEMAGLITEKPFPTYPRGFPPEAIEPFKKAIGRDILANQTASGTEIIKELGDEHVRTGFPIIYTSADSVFQIACHEEVVPLEQLYDWCRIARNILAGEHAVGRVIARPFIGASGSYQRGGGHRQDFSLQPPRPTILDHIKKAGLEVVGVGKIHDLYAGQGLTQSLHSDGNHDGMAKILDAWPKLSRGLLMANLVEFDMTWGHRNDMAGFYQGLRDFDAWLPGLLKTMTKDDLLFITADHGNDPTTSSTDHSREYVPLLVYGPGIKSGIDLGIRESFSDIAATLAEMFGITSTGQGTSFWPQVRS